MKKLFNLLVILVVLYFGIELSFINLNKGHTVEYKIKNNKRTFVVKEVYTQKKKNEKNNYYFEIKIDDMIFNYQTYNDYKKANYIIKKIDFYDGNYKCVNIKDKENKSISDVLCLKDNILYYYDSIKGEEEGLDNFVASLKGYSNYSDNTKNIIDANPVILYPNNLLENHYVALQNYKGVYLINKKDKIKNVKMFKNDIYTNESSIIGNKYYISADYDENYKFHDFYMVNIKNGSKNRITSDTAISLDSYMQGIIDNELYLFDKSSKTQYRINLKNDTVKIAGTKSEGIQIYKDNKFSTGSAYDASSNKIVFNKYTMDKIFEDKEYDRVDKIGNKLSGYYYLYLKDGEKYRVYRASIQNKKILTYLFSTTNIENIYYYDDYVYYIDGDYIKYYQNNLGIKTLLKNSEFEFNKSLKFGLYVD